MNGISKRTSSIVNEAIIVDVTVPMLPVHFYNPAAENTNFQKFIDEYIDAGVTWISLTASLDGVNSIGTAVKAIAATRNYILRRSDRFLLVQTVQDVHRAKTEGKLGINFNLQGTNALLGDLNLVETYRHLGVGHMLMAYNQANMAGDGCHEKTNGGLTQFGERLIAEMNRVGMIVDATHTGYRTTLDMCEVSSAPVIFSHSNARALVDHERNISDEQIRACAKTGGIIGIVGLGLFLTDERENVSAEAIIHHIDHVVNLVGPTHVGLGLDYVGTFTPEQDQAHLEFYRAHPETYPVSQRYVDGPLRFARPRVIPEIAEQLLNKGYTEGHVRGILGENFLRVCGEVWT